jgi:hypothetical protein
MQAKPMHYVLGTCLVAVMAATGGSRSSSFEARTSGAQVLELRGSAEFGEVEQAGGSGAFVLTLGAESPSGAVVFTWPTGTRPEPGVYPISEDTAGLRGLVLTGPVNSPTGAYRAQGGTLTVTRSREGLLQGRFDVNARGFEAATPMDEERPLEVRGQFTAKSASAHQTRTRSVGER